MNLLCLGVSHHTAPLSLLERVSFSAEAMDAFLAGLCATPEVDEAFGVSTCNRTEFYLGAKDIPAALELLLARIHDERGTDLRPTGSADSPSFFFSEEAAVRHLFRVVCGIDSLIIG